MGWAWMGLDGLGWVSGGVDMSVDVSVKARDDRKERVNKGREEKGKGLEALRDM